MATSETFAMSAIGTPLLWTIAEPNSVTFPPPWDVVLAFHPGGWAHGSRNGMTNVCLDLANAGILAMTCDYELTIDFLPGQSGIVSWPDQYPDCALAVAAARNPAPTSAVHGKTTGKVGTLGSSAGATLAIDTGLTGTVNGTRADCVCALSANYDFSDQDSLDQYEGQGDWINEVMLYNNVPDRTHTTQLYNQSVLPLALGATNIPALFMVQAGLDTGQEAVGPITSQLPQMVNALNSINFTNFTAVYVNGSAHGAGNWGVVNPATGNLVKVDAINFFKAAFIAGVGGGGDIPTSGFKLTLTGGPYTIVGAINNLILPESAREATITGLQGAADPGLEYTGSLVRYDPEGETEPVTTTFRVINNFTKTIPFGAYKLLNVQTNGNFWTTFITNDDTLAFPYVLGYRARTFQNLIQPGALDVYDFEGPDVAFEIIRDADKKVGFSIALGVGTSDEWYDTGGPNEVAKIAIDLADITPQAYQPVFWDPAHLAKMATFVAYLGAKYDADPTVSYFVVTGFMQLFEGKLSATAADDLQWDDAATAFGYANKTEAYLAGAKTIMGYWLTAFPNTQMYFSHARPFFNLAEGNAALAELEDWITSSTNNQIGIMTTGLHATEPPHDPPVTWTYPRIGQAISVESNTTRFYAPVAPDPYPGRVQGIDDLMKQGATEGRTVIEIYSVDIDDPACEDVITANNITLQSIIPTFP